MSRDIVKTDAQNLVLQKEIAVLENELQRIDFKLSTSMRDEKLEMFLEKKVLLERELEKRKAKLNPTIQINPLKDTNPFPNSLFTKQKTMTLKRQQM